MLAFVASHDSSSPEPILPVDWVREGDVGAVLEIVERPTNEARWRHDGAREPGHQLGTIELDNTTFDITHDEVGRVTEGAGAEFTYGPRGRLLYADRGGFAESYIYDADGRLAQVINEEGTGIDCHRWAYLPRFGFAGAYRSLYTGVTYMRNRWYAPKLGQFLTHDPLGTIDSHNMYAYAGMDPINFWDPYGLESVPFANDDCSFMARCDVRQGLQDEFNLPQDSAEKKRKQRESGEAMVRGVAKEAANQGLRDACSTFSMAASTACALALPHLEITAEEEVGQNIYDTVRTSAELIALPLATEAALELGAERMANFAALGLGLGPAGSSEAAVGRAGAMKPQLTANSCGPACGSQLLRESGLDVFQSNLTTGWYRGLDPKQLAENMSRFQPGWQGGFVGDTLSEAQLNTLLQNGAFIARTGGNNGHFVIVDSASSGVVYLRDPAGGVARSVGVSEFLEVVTGVVWR